MSRKRWIWAIAIVVGIAALLGGGAYAMRDNFTYAGLATTYAAKQTCSCMHVVGRTLESCLDDFPDPAARAQLKVTAEGDRVRASALFGVFHSEAVFEEEYGCRIVS
jgi:cytochrome c-type biogenesis protein CcmE